MSQYTHAICEHCWSLKHPNREPHIGRKKVETCCYCGVLTNSGILSRDDPSIPMCKGIGKIHEDGQEIR